MLQALDPPASSLDEFISQVVPADIRTSTELQIGGPEGWSSDVYRGGYSESQLTSRLRDIAKQNKILRSYIGCGYVGTRVPAVIQRNVLEGPAWYTSYTPYQAEISQGRLEGLLNFQTMVSDLTALPISNASLLDEPTAAAEAMTLSMSAMSMARQKRPNKTFVVSHLVHPQTIQVLRSRAEGFGVHIEVADVLHDNGKAVERVGEDLMGVLVQYPDTEGGVDDFRQLADRTHQLGATLNVATDLLALTVLTPPGEFGADIAFGSAQRLGVPMGFGGPHAAFFACSEKYKRKVPGRIVGVSKDRLGNRALRLALQTREQHIRREKATSNICTAQALLANMSALYAVYHGPRGLKEIALKIIACTRVLEEAIRRLGFGTGSRAKGQDGRALFDTLVVDVGANQAATVADWAVAHKGINLRTVDGARIGVTLDETVGREDLMDILAIFEHFSSRKLDSSLDEIARQLEAASADALPSIPAPLERKSAFMTHPVFNTYHSETELLRYIHHLQSRDLSLVHSMIPLGSCTMKLNATTEMLPVSWPEFSSVHPFAPADQTKGYATLIHELERDLAQITGFDAVTLQPNSGAQGEFTGLRLIRKYQEAQPGRKKRDICLIPTSAHGTNPASAAMAGMRVVTVKCEPSTGNLDMQDLEAKCQQHAEQLAAIMVTYPSTFGVFEPEIRRACDVVHAHGGQVYMDGANMNAQIGLCRPGDIGADVCHLNLHKTFCIPHGGGGPGVGPVGVKSHLAPFLPGHPFAKTGGEKAIAPVSGAPWGSASILPISWAYIKMMGS
jgi:glycine dehydrogenase